MHLDGKQQYLIGAVLDISPKATVVSSASRGESCRLEITAALTRLQQMLSPHVRPLLPECSSLVTFRGLFAALGRIIEPTESCLAM